MKISKKVKELFLKPEWIELHKELNLNYEQLNQLKENKINDEGLAKLEELHITSSRGHSVRWEIFFHRGGGERVDFNSKEEAEEYLSDNGYVFNCSSGCKTKEYKNKTLADRYSSYIRELNSVKERIREISDALRENANNIFHENFQTVYIRFGLIPKSGKSYNFRDGFFENGVSCFEAVKIGGNYVINVVGGMFTYYGYLESKMPYLLSGDVLKSVGSDGEPLLANAKIVKKLNSNNFFLRDDFICEIYNDVEE